MISNKKQIEAYLHCSQCIKEVKQKEEISPSEYQNIEVGWTKHGIQVWCKRHDCNIINIDFEGQKHHANTSSKK